MKTIKTKTLRQSATFNARPHEIYEMLMNSKKHSRFSGQKATISRKVGGRFTAYGGWIGGKNLELVKNKRIVQLWRGKDWPKNHYSTATFSLKKKGNSTRLDFVQSGIPQDRYKDINKGWREHYWEKMRQALE